MADLRTIIPLKRELRQGFIISNDFGAEVMPAATRILRPFSRIIAIAHTHPLSGSENDIWMRRIVEKLCYWSCSRVVFNSYALMLMWEQKLRRRLRKGRVVHHGMPVPEDLTVPAAYPPKIPGILDVVCVGLFYRWKGQLALIEAWPEVLAACPHPLRLVLVGDGACLEEARAKAQTLGLGDQHIVFCGFQKDGAAFFNGADIALHYPVEPEAFGLVLLEAMVRGKPVIAPAHGGATEIVTDGVTGYLVAPGTAQAEDSETLDVRREALGVSRSTFHVEAICRLAEDAELRQRMGAAGRERVRTEFSVEKMLAGYDAVFRELNTKTRRY